MFHLISDVYCIPVFHVSEVCLESHGSTTQMLGDGALGSSRPGVLVLVSTPGSCPHEERGGCQGK
jgi:hypothetical protein